MADKAILTTQNAENMKGIDFSEYFDEGIEVQGIPPEVIVKEVLEDQ